MSFKSNVPETFQNCLSAILETRGISATQLAAMLGYKSKTTLLRILQGDAGLRCVGNVYKDLCCCAALRLTEQETDRLHIAYEVELWGLDNYRARMEMWHLLRRNDTPALPMELMTCGKTITLQELLDAIVPEGVPGEMPVSSLEIMMLSGCYPNVMEQLAGLLERMGNRIRATQLFMLNNDTARTVRMIRNIMPVLGFHSYEAYYVYPSIIIPDPLYSGSGTGKVMILRAVLPDGKAREFQVLMQGETTGVLLEADGIWNCWQQFTAGYLAQAVPLKAAVPAVTDYISLVENYLETERNRELLIYKGDVCFNNIPTDILLRALMDSMAKDELAAESEYSVPQVLQKLRSVQEKRYQNQMTKRQPTHWVASAAALYEFARTGVQNDHFFAMRPFTVEERLRIFRILLDQVRQNPYFHLYLLLAEEEASYIPLEVLHIDGVGFQITSCGTDYRLTDGWTETTLTEETFCSLFREFFMEELIARHTRPAAETERVLEDIIRQLQAQKN